MHIITMLVLPVLLLLSAVESTPTFEYQDFSGETLVCDKCPPGTHMAAYCTAATPTVCAPCRSHHFTELWNYLPKCLYCQNVCTENQDVVTECAATSDRVCRCKAGFYSISDFCMRHSECGAGQGVKTKGTSEMNTVCEPCTGGYFSSSSSALEPCVKHQECASGQIALLNGTTSHDTMCGSCEDLTNGGETLRTFFSGFFRKHKIRGTKLKKFVASTMNTEEATLPKQRGALMDHFRAWLAHAPEEQLKRLLKAAPLRCVTDKLETILNAIKQQSPNCSLLL